MKFLIIVPFLILAILLSGCGNTSGGGGGGKGGGNSKNSFIPRTGGGGGGGERDENPRNNNGISCVVGQNTACLDFIGQGWNQQLMTQVCGQINGQLLNGSCNTQNQIASCTFHRGTDKEAVAHYFTPLTLDFAQRDCASGGGEMN